MVKKHKTKLTQIKGLISGLMNLCSRIIKAFYYLYITIDCYWLSITYNNEIHFYFYSSAKALIAHFSYSAENVTLKLFQLE